jgi:hypothetical protein
VAGALWNSRQKFLKLCPSSVQKHDWNWKSRAHRNVTFWGSLESMTRMSKLLLTLVAATQGLQLHTGFVVPNGLHATPLGVATLRSQLRQARENSNGVRAYLWWHLWSLWMQPTIKNAPPPQVPLSNSVGLETEKTQPTEATLDWLQQYSRTREVTNNSGP